MHQLAICMVRRENQHYQLKYALQCLKLNSVRTRLNHRNISFRDTEEFARNQCKSDSHAKEWSLSVELQNKQLYLKYMEEVLTNKEQELIELQEYLFKYRQKEQNQQIQKKVSQPLTLNYQAEVINKKIDIFKQFIRKYSSKNSNLAADKDFDQFVKSLSVVEQACRKNYDTLKDDIVQQHQEINAQRHQIQMKLSKLNELQSYEKYLNQLQQALQQKQYQIIMKKQKDNQEQFFVVQNQTLSLNAPSSKYQTYGSEEQKQKNNNNTLNDQSVRKRAKIFQNKASSTSQLDKILPVHKESSKIMQEISTNNDMQKISKSSEKITSVQKTYNQIAIQTSPNCLEQSHLKMQRQKLHIKFLRLWMKFSQKHTKSNTPLQHKKTMNLYVWRLNAIYDENIKEKIQQNLNWPKKIQNLGELPPINYSQLSLKKKKYMEMFFDYERRKFQRNKIVTLLKNITRNKSRKERTAIVLIFRKYRQNIKLEGLLSFLPIKDQQIQAEAVLKERTNKNQVDLSKVKNLGSSRNQAESRLFTISSSNIIQNKGQHMDHTSKGKIAKDSSKNISTNNASQGNSKVKLNSKQNIIATNVDMIKLKDYIKSQEEAEIRLAIECAQTQSVYRINAILTPAATRLRYAFISNLCRLTDSVKMNQLQRSISSIQFKWQLFMAKARLGLTNNSNKVAHLQQLISFIGDK